MSATPPNRRSAKTVLRSIVSPALGVAVGALVVAGAASACSSTTSNADDSTMGPVGIVGERPRPTPSDEPSATPTTSASAPEPMPKPGDMPDVGVTSPQVKVGMTPERPGTRSPPPPGITPAPGFTSTAFHSGGPRSPSAGFAVEAPPVRPTRRTRHVTDADTALLRGARRALA